MFPMNNDQREIRRKLRMLEQAWRHWNIRKTCRYFGIGRSSFYRWRDVYRLQGEADLINAGPSDRSSNIAARRIAA